MKLFGSLVAIVTLSACGTAQTSATVTDVTAPPNTSLLKPDFVVRPINGGFNSAFSGFRIEGEIFAGANPCLASAAKVSFEQKIEKVGAFKVIHVYPIKTGGPAANVRCSREFMPVTLPAVLEIRTDMTTTKDIVVHNVQDESTPVSLLGKSAGENLERTVLGGVEVSPANGGANPAFAAYRVSGKILLGTNACFGSGKTAELVQRDVGGVTVVTPVLRSAPGLENHICPMVYLPVFQDVSTLVIGKPADLNRAVLENAFTSGTRLKIAEFPRN